MIFLKKANAFLLGLAMLLALGCSKDDDANTVTPGNPVPENFSRCQLISDRDDTLTSKYTFNPQGLLLEKSNAYRKEKFEYNNLGKVSKVVRLSSRLDTSNVLLYAYNQDSLPVTVSSRPGVAFTGGTPEWSTQAIAYDSQKRVISKISYDRNQTVTYKLIYRHPVNNKIEIEAWELNTATKVLQLHYNAQFTYDDNPTPWGDNAFLNPLVNYNELSYAAQFSQPFAYSHARTTTYTYNAAGYPIERTDITDGQHINRATYNYNCQ